MYFPDTHTRALLQDEDGHWPGDYGGPMFLMPGLVIVCHVTGCMDQVLPATHRQEMLRYLRNHQNADGGYGLHIEGHSTMFGTVLSYVTARLLGAGADEGWVAEARAWIHARECGAVGTPSWGKFWLALLGVYEWSGLNPMPPEMWCAPYALNPLHPGRYWCHCRMVYLPMSYVYGKRWTGPKSDLTEAIKEELYASRGGYDKIDWEAARSECAAEDLYYPHPLIQDAVWWGLSKAEPMLLEGGSLHWLRRKALTEVMKHVHYEDKNTRYVDIGPVNKVINMLCCYIEDPTGLAFRRHKARVPDYLWVAEDGMKMQGYNGSQLWDTSFAVQALAAAGPEFLERFAPALRAAHAYVDTSQVRVEASGSLPEHYRHQSKGAWPFSTQDHGWPISDCTSEGLKAALVLAELPAEKVGAPIPAGRLAECVDIILSYQNADGGWATYENTRSWPWVELFNPAETFGDIMIDYSYVECSSACMTALAAFREQHPAVRAADIRKAIARGRQYLLSIQRPDGSWYGSWGVCFTYAAWFGIKGLLAAGETYASCGAIRRAVAFLLSKEIPGGGWGESYLSCQDKVYVSLDAPHAVNTAWAMLALLACGALGRGGEQAQALHRGASALMASQLPSGDWPQESITGVFNRNCMISYSQYRNIFPLWALGEYRTLLGEHEAAAAE